MGDVTDEADDVEDLVRIVWLGNEAQGDVAVLACVSYTCAREEDRRAEPLVQMVGKIRAIVAMSQVEIHKRKVGPLPFHQVECSGDSVHRT